MSAADSVARFVSANPDIAAADPIALPGDAPKRLRVPVAAHLVLSCVLLFGLVFTVLVLADPDWLRQNMPPAQSTKDLWMQRASRAIAISTGALALYLVVWWLSASSIVHRKAKENNEREITWKRALLS